MKVLVIGGTRFIGTFVVEQLLSKGHEIALFHRGNQEKKYDNVINIIGDRNHLIEHKNDFRAFNPDIVLDMIPFTMNNADQLINTFNSITDKVVAISSGDVYEAFGRVLGVETSPIDNEIITETSSLRKNLFLFKGVEGREEYEKILVEKAFLESEKMHTTILRLPLVYGPRDYQHRTFKYLKRINDNRPYILLEESYANWKWTKGYVENVAAGIVLALENHKAKDMIYNIGAPETLTMKQWIMDIGTTIGWKGDVITVPKEKLPKAMVEQINTHQHVHVDSSLIRREIGYVEPISYLQGLRKTVEWELLNPPKFSVEEFDYIEEDKVIKRL